MTAAALPLSVPPTNIMGLLRQRYCGPEWVLAAEVTLGNRRMDALAMNQWASRGRLLAGFEIKVSRSDWLRELKDFQKAEHAFMECDQFYLVTPKEIVKDGELPVGWGHLQVYGNGLRQMVAPARVTPPPTMSRELASRLLSRYVDTEQREAWQREQADRSKVRAEITAQMASKYEADTKEMKAELERLRTDHGALLAALGTRFRVWNGQESALKAAAVLSRAIDEVERGDERIRKMLTEHAAQCAAGLAALDGIGTTMSDRRNGSEATR